MQYAKTANKVVEIISSAFLNIPTTFSHKFLPLMKEAHCVMQCASFVLYLFHKILYPVNAA